MSPRTFGPISIPTEFKGWRETLDLPEVVIDVDETGLTVTPIDSRGRRQAALAFRVKEG